MAVKNSKCNSTHSAEYKRTGRGNIRKIWYSAFVLLIWHTDRSL